MHTHRGSGEVDRCGKAKANRVFMLLQGTGSRVS